jgi:L-amino acid N-acyltransferase YncA
MELCLTYHAAMTARPATPADADAIAIIYNQGIEDHVATFETRFRTPADIHAWFGSRYPVVVVEENREVLAFAAASSYRPRACYSGIAEVSIYVARAHRRRGAGRLALKELMRAAERAGFWKLLSRVFTDNTASRALIRSLGFREVGIYEKHGCLDGVWRDVVIVEHVIPANLHGEL